MQQCIDDGNYKIQEPKTRLADEIKLKHEQNTSDDSAVRRAAKILRAYVEKYGMQSSDAVEAQACGRADLTFVDSILEYQDNVPRSLASFVDEL